MHTDMAPSWKTIGPNLPDQIRESPATLSDVLYKSSALRSFLDEAADEKKPIILVINDSHRATPTRQVLQVLCERIRRSGRSYRLQALIATGTHRFSESQRRHFKSATFDECGLRIDDVSWHDAEDAANLVARGHVRVNRLIAESRFLLPIGSVEPPIEPALSAAVAASSTRSSVVPPTAPTEYSTNSCVVISKLPIFSDRISANHSRPSSSNSRSNVTEFAVGITNSVISSVFRSSLPILLDSASANHALPSGPISMP